MSEEHNKRLVLISGRTGTGKSASLASLKDDLGVWYANCESGKDLPFNAKFGQFIITDPENQIEELFEAAEQDDSVHTIVIDTLTFMMDMYESQHVIGADGFEGWKKYQQFFKRIMSQYVALSTKTVIFLAHTTTTYNAEEMVNQVYVPVKGALKEKGIESFFSIVLSTKVMSIKDLKGYNNDLLNITEEEELVGYKHVFQTRITKDTINERIRGPMGMWSVQETFIDNNIEFVNQRLNEYYS